jgi:hypothetical protein
MRTHPGWLVAALLLLAPGCAEEEPAAVLDYTVMGATPAVPLSALQVFEIDAAGSSSGSIAVIWGGDVPLPDRGTIGYYGDLPPTFQLCAVGLGEGGELLHALSEPIRLAFEERVSAVMTLQLVEPGGEVPEPCGSEIEPWPEDV